MADKQFKCPLCDSFLTESKYYEVVRISEEQKKIEESLKKQLSIAKSEREKLELEKKKLAKDQIELKKKLEAEFEKQKSSLIKNAQKKGLEEGIEKQKKRYEQVSKLYQSAQKRLEEKESEVKKLREEIKKGTTPQLEGIDLEHELVKELKQKFPNDRIEHHGKGGDILHYISSEGKEIALIVYECKKTKAHSKSHVDQIKNDVISHKANYGILVTSASIKNKSGFWTERGILIVHPWGAPYLADILRRSLIQLYSLKLSDKELDERAKKLLGYIKSNKFKNSIKDNINRTKELNDILKREIEYHKTCWEQRNNHYGAIAKQSKEIENESETIVGENSGLEENEQILHLEIKPKRKKKLMNLDY